MSHLTLLTKELEKMKPVRVCRWAECPRDGEYKGIKMRACSQCRWVRYCSTACQRAHWPEHKECCRWNQGGDFAEWITSFEWLFEWAAAQALGGLHGPNRTSTHCVKMRSMRMTDFGIPVPTPFFLYDVSLITLEELRAAAPETDAEWDGRDPSGLGRQIYDNIEQAEDAQIKREGGMGKALVLVQGYETRGVQWVLRRYKLRDADTWHRFPGWRSVVRDVGSGMLSIQDLIRGMEQAPKVCRPVVSPNSNDFDEEDDAAYADLVLRMYAALAMSYRY